MRNALLLTIAGLASFTLFACGDASTSTNQRGVGAGGAVPDEGSTQVDDPTQDQTPSKPNPNASTPPAKPATPGTTTGAIAVALSSATPSLDLGTTQDITVTVTPTGSVTGTAALTVTGLPTGVTAVFAPASVTLGTAPVTAKMTITVPATAAPSPAGSPSAIVVTATAGTNVATANANLKVSPQLTMTIPVNSTALIAASAGTTTYVDGWFGPMFGSAPQPLKTQAGNVINVLVKNADSKPYEVHGNAGFPHGSATVAPGQLDNKTRTLDVGTTTSGYIHGVTSPASTNAGVAVGFRISVVAAP